MSAALPRRVLPALLRDARVLRGVGQAVFLVLLIWLLVGVWDNITTTLEQRGLSPNFTFLEQRAGFEIGGARDYSPDDSYWEAYVVGLRNTLLTVVVGLIGATVLGILGGIFLLSTNWLIRTITRAIVEFLRNVPLLVVIYVAFFVGVLSLPPLRDSFTFPGAGLLAVPLRYGVYVLIALGLLITQRRAAPLRRSAYWAGFSAAVVLIEIAYALAGWPEAFPFMDGLRGIGNPLDPRLIAYSVVSLGLIAAVLTLRPSAERTIAAAALLGQWIGGLAFAFGVAFDQAWIVETTPAFYLNNRGFIFPETYATGRFGEWMAFVLTGAGLGALAFAYLRRLTEATGTPYPRGRIAALILLAFTVIGWWVVSSQPAPSLIPVRGDDGAVQFLPIDEARAAGLLTRQDELAYAPTPIAAVLPARQGLRFGSGETLSPEYVALTLALIIYTAAFIAEVVRAGILAVPRGQLEAARALGLSGGQVLRLVILPQALRVIIPPLTNQYLNLAKNSSLAIAISFADVYQVMGTVINQSGQAVTGILMIMITYLILSLITAAVMNVVNARYQLVTR